MRGRNVGVDIKVGKETVHIDIPAGGYRAKSKEEEEALSDHELYGHSFGFVGLAPSELKNEKTPLFNGEATVPYRKPAEAKKPKVEIVDEEEEDTPTAESVTNFNEAQAFLKEVHGLDHKDVGSKDKVYHEAKKLGVEFPNYPKEDSSGSDVVVAEDTPDSNEDGEITVEDVTKINHAKDYLKDELGVNGREISTPDKILAKAKELNVSFPNLELEN